ncbi:hypothetical protein [Achromobacter insuavis]|uniref:hypothetical protein n=1 Tax=Achromobacter insuavis TaxID=1287735 RepID=UPI001F1371A8|nr:hypothetical protein [Achromobacter insuavis]
MTNPNNAAQAATKEIREGFELTYAADADDPACASDLSHFTNGWQACIASQVRAPVADGWQSIKTAPQGVRVLLGPRHAPVIGIVKHYEDADSDEPAIVCNVVHYNGTVLVAGYRTGEWAPLASAPVAGEAVTDKMIQAGAKAAREYFERTGGNDPAVIYRAMRAAAPAAPQAGECECARKSKAVANSEAQL